jgi:hypothetical protein
MTDWTRFSNPRSSGTVRLFHGTSMQQAKAAVEDGFKARRHGLYLTDSLSIASVYAAKAAWDENDQAGAVVAVTVPFDKLKPDFWAFSFYCFATRGGLYSTPQQVLQAGCPLARTAEESMKLVGSATLMGKSVRAADVAIVKRVKPKQGGSPTDRRRPMVKTAHSQG